MQAKFVGLIFLGMWLTLGSRATQATPITFNFGGTATNASGIWAGATSLTGSFTYDSALVDLNQGDSFNDTFRADTLANQGFAWEITVTANGVTRSTSTNQNIAGTLHHFLQVLDDPTEDRWFLQADKLAASDDFAQLLLQDFVPSPPDGITAGSGNLTDMAPTTAPNPGLFSVNTSSIYQAFTDNGMFEGALEYRLDTISIVPVPPAVWLFGSGLIGLIGIARRRRKAT